MLPRSALFALAVATATGAAHAQTPPDSLRSTLGGVYAEEQATKGKDVYLGQCQSCHTAADFTNPDFRSKWVGKVLAEFFTYLVENMPESEPGALSQEQYAQVTAYILQLNGLPPGATPLPATADSLKGIRIDVQPAVPSAQAAHRQLQASSRGRRR